MRFDTYLLGAVCAAGSTLAHMEMDWPYALRSKFDPNKSDSYVDYSNTDPLKSDGSNFPCKGYQNNTPLRIVASYTAGQTYNMSLAGSSTHSGGSCQLSLSYDNGATFKVIQSMEGGCPLVSKYNFKVPSSAPSGNALFAWSWFNLIGNREMYMNCADVSVSGGNGNTAAFNSLPNLFAANTGNGCKTVENKEVVFANPGSEVVYGGSVTSSSSVFPVC